MTCAYQEIVASVEGKITHKARFVCDNCYTSRRVRTVKQLNGPHGWKRIESPGDRLFGYQPVTLHFCSAMCEAAYRKKKG